MTRVKISLVISFIISAQQLYACNSCGQVLAVSPSSSLLQNVMTNYVSIQYQHASFEQNSETYTSTKDKMQSLRLEAKMRCYKNLFVSATLPWNYNTRNFVDHNVVNQGVGDIQLMTDYRFKQISIKKKIAINPILNVGVKLPTGKYQHYIKSYDIPRSFNAGTGALALIFNPMVIVKYKRLGWSNSYFFLHNCTNKYDYQFGAQESFQSTFFYNFKYNEKRDVVPLLGINLEQMRNDKLALGLLDKTTGSKTCFLNAGINFFSKKNAYSISYQLPIAQDYANSQSKTNGIIALRYSQFFNKK